MKVEKIFIDRESLSYLKSRGLISQFRKAKFFILNGLYKNVDFKIREPKDKGKYYFRINKQYRAIGKFKGNNFHIMEVYDHKR